MTKPLPPVTPESIARAIAERDAERAANGIICDQDGKVLYVADRKVSA